MGRKRKEEARYQINDRALQNPRQFSFLAETHESLGVVLFAGAKTERVIEDFGLRDFQRIPIQTPSQPPYQKSV